MRRGEIMKKRCFKCSHMVYAGEGVKLDRAPKDRFACELTVRKFQSDGEGVKFVKLLDGKQCKNFVFDRRSAVPVRCLFQDSPGYWVYDYNTQKQPLNNSELPSWYKIRSWIYHVATKQYAKIERFTNDGFVAENGDVFKCSPSLFSEARLRPWTFEEAEPVIKMENLFVLYLYSRDKGYYSPTIGEYCTLEELVSRRGYKGKLFGVLEHFDANREEWVR